MWVLAQQASTGQTLPAPCLEGPMLGSTVLCSYSEIFNIYEKVNTIVEVMMKW